MGDLFVVVERSVSGVQEQNHRGERPGKSIYLTQSGDLEHVQAGAEQQVAELDGLLLKLGRDGHVGGSGRHL